MQGRFVLALVACLASGFKLIAAEPNNFVYQIFVRSFADTPSDTHPQGEIGDLRGIREQLDYLNDGVPGKGKDLEVGILWLMPIFPSGTYHGYDIDDYRAVNPEYGSMRDLRDLIAECHRRGLRIILDIAFNHTSTRHRWFQEAVRDANSPFRRFYHIRTANGRRAAGWHTTNGIEYFGQFSSRMPDLNLAEPAVRQEIKAVAKFWLDQGVDGFRLDAAKHVFDDGVAPLSDDEIARNNAWWREFSDYVHSVNPKALLVGEVLGPPELLAKHAAGLDALLDEPFMDLAREYLTNPTPGFLERWRNASRGYNPWIFVGSHDRTPRLASLLEREHSYRVAMFLLLTLGRFPVLYNGDELMQRGVKWPGSEDGSRIYDETLREPFPWNAANKAVPPQTGWFSPRYDQSNDGVSVEEQNARGKMLDFVRGLGQFRGRHPAFANGKIDSVLLDTERSLVFTKGRYLVFVRTDPTAPEYTPPAEWRGAKRIFESDIGFVLSRL